MSKRWIAAIAFGLILGLSVPSIADHINEPINPITGLHVDLFQYPDGEPLACDGSDLVDFPAMRIHVNVDAEKYGLGVPLGREPSEHFDVGVTVHRLARHSIKQPNRLVFFPQWNLSWLHQNIGPHSNYNATEYRANMWELQRYKTWKVNTTVTGNESGTVLSHECIFDTANGTLVHITR